MKWGCFCKKVENGGISVKKMENGGCFFCKKNSGKWGCFGKKGGPFLKAGCNMYSISIFNFTFYLFGGMRTHPTHPPAYGPDGSTVQLHVQVLDANMSTI